MSTNSPTTEDRLRTALRRSALWLFAIGMTLAMTLILSLDIGRQSQVAVALGQPAPEDIFAPRALTYTSDLLTQQAREQAVRAVTESFTPLDLSIGRAQLAQAREVFAFIDTVRADTSASTDQKLQSLQSIEPIRISEEVALGLLELSQAEYEQAQADILAIVEDLMREEIRPSQLGDFQRTARRLASLALSPLQTTVVTEIAYQYIVPTVFPDEVATAEARQAAAAAIEPVSRSVAADQRIVRAGDIVSAADMELLEELGLLQRELSWRYVASMFMASVLVVGLTLIYWLRFQRETFPNGRYVLVLAILMLIFTLGAKIMTSSDTLLLLYPLAALSMLLAVVYDIRFSMLVTILMAALTGFIVPNSLESAIYLAAGGILSALTLYDTQRVSRFFRGGIWAAVGYLFVLVMFWLPRELELPSIVQPALLAVGNGILSSGLTLAGFYVLGGLFGIVTLLQLQDLSRLDHPLLRELLRRAPGTYHHSIMVANLAEQAAERVGANSTLVRVGAFYHDVGKMVRPAFFTENQEGTNPHDSLDPFTSARIIISHVKDGLDFARRYRLPFRITDIIAQHHGQRVVKSFYRKAEELAGDAADEIDMALFSYPGPRPQFRESGIVMLADAIEAASSAVRPNTEKAIEKLVDTIIEDDLLSHQLDASGLTMGDIQQIRASFIETLKGRFHVRVQYPGNDEITELDVAAAEEMNLLEEATTDTLEVSEPVESEPVGTAP